MRLHFSGERERRESGRDQADPGSRRAQAKAITGSPGALLQLQQFAGNAAVVALLSTSSTTTPDEDGLTEDLEARRRFNAGLTLAPDQLPGRSVGPRPRAVSAAYSVVQPTNGMPTRAPARVDVQRQPAAVPDPVAKAEWDAHKGIQGHFRGGFDGGRDSYIDLRSLYQAKGIADPAAYLATNIVQVSFFGHKTPAHADLTSKLSAAEAALKGAKVVPAITDFWAFVPRRMASGSLSNHALGRAIDIDHVTNPHVTNVNEKLVIRVLTGIDLGSSQTAADMRAASQAFQANFSATWIDEQKAALTALKSVKKPTAVEMEKMANLTKVIGAINSRRSPLDRYAAEGFLNLEQALIDALTSSGFGWGGDYGRSKDFMHFEVP